MTAGIRLIASDGRTYRKSLVGLIGPNDSILAGNQDNDKEKTTL